MIPFLWTVSIFMAMAVTSHLNRARSRRQKGLLWRKIARLENKQ